MSPFTVPTAYASAHLIIMAAWASAFMLTMIYLALLA